MKVITRHELLDNPDAVLDAVVTGETYRITRDGAAVAEFRPLSRRRRLTAEELVGEDRVGDDL